LRGAKKLREVRISEMREEPSYGTSHVEKRRNKKKKIKRGVCKNFPSDRYSALSQSKKGHNSRFGGEMQSTQMGERLLVHIHFQMDAPGGKGDQEGNEPATVTYEAHKYMSLGIRRKRGIREAIRGGRGVRTA